MRPYCTKLAILPDYKCPRMLFLALPPCQKFGLVLVKKWLQKINLTKNVLLKSYSSMTKKIRKVLKVLLPRLMTLLNSAFTNHLGHTIWVQFF